MAAKAAAAIAAYTLCRHSSRPLLHSSFHPNPHLLLFSTSPLSESFEARPRALRPSKLSSDGSDGENDDEGLSARGDAFKKSRNELKREARRAVRWGMDISTLSPSQIKRILRAASLEREVLDAILLVKRLGPDVREGRRRQFNYIGRLLRKVQPELMDALIQTSKDGGTLSSIDDDEDDEDDLEYEFEEGNNYMEMANKWLDGLIYKDPSITNEVYSVHSVDFDRQELRRLVRKVQSIQEGSNADESGLDGDTALTKAKKPLLSFLRSLAKKSSV